MSLRSKILLGYGFAMALTALVLGWSVANLVALGRASEEILRENFVSILAAHEMADAQQRQLATILRRLSDPGEHDAVLFEVQERRFEEWFERARANITIDGEARILEGVSAGHRAFREAAAGLLVLQPGIAVDRGTAMSALAAIQPVADATIVGLEELRRLNQSTMYAASRNAKTLAVDAIWSTSLIGAGALVAGCVLSLLLAHRTTRPLARLSSAARRIAGGDYAVSLETGANDEIGVLTAEFNEMVRKLIAFREMDLDRLVAEKQKSDAIVQAIDDGVVLVGPDLKVLELNDAARRLLSAGATRPANGRRLAEVVGDERVEAEARAVLGGGQPAGGPDDERVVVVGSGGSERHLDFSVTPIMGDQNRVAGAVLVLRDVSRFRQLDRLKSEFVMAVSHELQTPLTGLGMSVALLGEHVMDNLDEEDRELLAAANDEVFRLTALVRDLLDLSKIEAGRIELEIVPTPVLDFAHRARAIFAGQLEAKAISLEVEMPGEPLEVRADANKMTWVITNLISNALRYVDEGGKIRLGARPGPSFVEIWVEDDGPGIPTADQGRIFDKFVTVAHEGRGRGTGLGLTISREIVRAHGGTIWVESEPGRGSRFTFTLPRARA